jgi:predicted nucleotidyltransferase
MAFDWTLQSGDHPWLSERTILLCRHGSHAYGTSLPTSDDDYRGVCIAPRESYLLGGVYKFEQHVQSKPDLAVFELSKFALLAANASPNFIELLFMDEADRLLVTPAGERLIAARGLFLSRRVLTSFSECALSQIRRIGHDRSKSKNILNPATAALHAAHGFNTKQAMHSVRILRMCREILQTGRVLVRRPDAEELLAIRGGAKTYEEISEWAHAEKEELRSLERTSDLPEDPDFAAIDRLCVELISEAIR